MVLNVWWPNLNFSTWLWFVRDRHSGELVLWTSSFGLSPGYPDVVLFSPAMMDSHRESGAASLFGKSRVVNTFMISSTYYQFIQSETPFVSWELCFSFFLFKKKVLEVKIWDFLKRARRKDTSLGFRVGSRSARAIQRNPVMKNQIRSNQPTNRPTKQQTNFLGMDLALRKDEKI